ncbi:ABC transporter ATP-binding protein [Neobacillus niacini]|uniref:ABC transporter ATP-binding protein n=1 Tax=Neobacillus niacini TaxID=86668 RepID=UPI00052FC3B1|nr:ABC transporter ATP-binding protein [Neobacillus niacini]KGM44907.1 ABC transporter [Neobacillus niacini]MEC1523948.1 ABC transporter ATP-binding protein [Neobacillus niacini]
MNIIECSSLTKVYGAVKALNNLSFELQENKITGLIGRNGAGKTTLLKIIAGYYRETLGEIKVFSEKPFNNLLVSANVMYINDQMNFPTALNLKEILNVSSTFYENWNHELADRLFDYFAFQQTQQYNNLSKGMKSTFNMIVGLSARCALTVFDEPTTGMDAGVRKDFYRALLKDYIDFPRTILLSSHHLDEIEDILEDVLLIKDGTKLLHIPVEELKEWAIGVQGSSAAVNDWIKNREVIHSKNVGLDRMYAVVKQNGSESEIQRAKEAGLAITPISSSDVCVYLTSKNKGGIDDVFIKD